MTIEMRWGIPELDQEIAMTRIPNFILEYAAELSVTPQELAMIIHLAAFRYESARGISKPAIMTIATLMGYTDDKQVRRMIRRLESLTLLQVTRVTGETSIYDFKGLSQKCLDMFRERGLPSKGVGGLPSRGGGDSPSKGVEEVKYKEGKPKKLSDPDGPGADLETKPANPSPSGENLDAPKPTRSAAPRKTSKLPKVETHPLRRQHAEDGVSPNPYWAVACAFWLNKSPDQVTHADVTGLMSQIVMKDGIFAVGGAFEQLYEERGGFTPQQLQGALSQWAKEHRDTPVSMRPKKGTLYGQIVPLMPAPVSAKKGKRYQTVFDENGAPIGGEWVDEN